MMRKLLAPSVLALALAALVWVIAVREEYPQRDFGQPVPVSRSGLSADKLSMAVIISTTEEALA